MAEPAGPQLVPTSSHRSGATVVFALTALVWTVWLGAIASALSEHELYVFLWCGSAVALWFLLLGELRNPARPALSIAFKWWVLTLGGPLGLAYVLYVRNNSAPNRLSIRSAQPTTSESADLAGRVAFGGVASGIVFGAGLWLQRRYETTYSALVAVGTGIAGAYITLLAAVSLYDMVSKPVALVLAAVIASIAVAVSLVWEAEVVAGFGLIGAMIVPATLVFQGGLREIGTAFVAVVFAGATIVAVRRRWWILLQVSALVSVPQALAQVAAADSPHSSIVSLAVAFSLLYLVAGLAFQFELGPALAAAPASFLMGGAVFAGVSAALLYGQREGGLEQGIALLVAAAVYVALAAALYRRARETATLLGALGLALAAIGL